MTRLNEIKTHLLHTDSPFLRRALVQQLTAEQLREDIRACTACPLSKSRTQAVPFTGPTHGRAEFVIVGEAPGAMEDKHGEPFVGRSGMLLNNCLEKAGTSRSQVAIFNSIACRPPDNRDPAPSELAACRPLFERQLAMTNTWIGVALGGYALANVMGVDRHSISIKNYLDKPIWVNGRIWFGTYHPSYALRTLGAKSEIILTLKAAIALRRGDAQFPPMSWGRNEKTRKAEQTKILSELDIMGDGGRDFGKKLDRFGWTYGYSEALGDRILVLLSEDKPPKKPIPSVLLNNAPIYTLSELVKLGEAGAARGGWKQEDMRRLHMVKVELGGEIIA